jgi:aspartate-semialdehyde dehydrogenase
MPTENILQNLPDVSMFMANESVAKVYIPQLAKLGVTCIDNSSYFRLQSDVPLVVPSINGHTIGQSKIIANPNCTTIQVAMALDCLKSLVPYKATVATYQAVSGAGREGLADLAENRSYGKLRAFAHPIANNVLPLVGSVTESGYSTEEIKMQNECAKILDADIAINCFCARVPVTVGHSAFVNVQFERPFTIEQVTSLLQKGCDILTFDQKDGNLLPMPMCLRGSKYVGVGRIVRDQTTNGINMFVVADNVLRGASYNAYAILQCVLEGKYE